MKSRLVLVGVLSLVIISGSTIAYAAAAGAVYTETNASTTNAVLVFSRGEDGQLSSANLAAFPTGGRGTGIALGSQGAVAIDAANQFLFAVNAGSNNISVFRIIDRGLALVGVTPSGGTNPISLTVTHNVLYVLNAGGSAGGSDSVAGFSVDDNGNLTSIVSGLLLSAASVSPEEIRFNADGNLLVVTEKAGNNIDVFTVNREGLASGPSITPSAAANPYGFAFAKRNQLIVSDAEGGSNGAGAVSSYAASQGGTLQTITAMSADGQTAPCWIALTADGRYAFTTNTGSGTVSSYKVGFDGTLTLLNGVAANTGNNSSPLDEAVSNDSRYLYVLTSAVGKIQGFTIALDGSLTPLPITTGVMSSTSGLVAR